MIARNHSLRFVWISSSGFDWDTCFGGNESSKSYFPGSGLLEAAMPEAALILKARIRLQLHPNTIVLLLASEAG